MQGNTGPLVTIGIPTYNRAGSYLKQAIECVLNQTYQNIELIISDNYSTDNTESLISEFQDKRLKYIRHAINIGPNNNFNYCLEQARGDYFLLLHDDDLIDVDFVEFCMNQAGYTTDFGIIRTGARIIDSAGRTTNESPNHAGGLPIGAYFRGWFNYNTSWYFCNTLFHTERLKDIGGFHSNHNLTQDGMAIAQLTSKYYRLDIPNIKASFRKHSDEFTFAVKVKYWCEDFSDLLDLMCRLTLDDKEAVRDEGQQFFAKICYNFADTIKYPFSRFISYLIVFKKFGCRNPLRIIRRFFYKSQIYSDLRKIKRKIFTNQDKMKQ